MHNSVKNFIRNLNLSGKILEVGSYDVNGSVREFFDDYIGIDMRIGPNVDIVADASDIPFVNNMFDNVLCLEMLEHDLTFWKSIEEMKRVLKPGGKLIITARGIQFPLHDYPSDYYRFTISSFIDLCNLFDLNVISVTNDPEQSGVFCVSQKR